jgi:superfamily II DNA or RNA helicase
MILQIVKWQINLSEIYFKFLLKRAIKRANRDAEIFNKKYLVVAFAGRPKAYQKQALKELVKKRTGFKKGTTMEKIEKMAYYVTT